MNTRKDDYYVTSDDFVGFKVRFFSWPSGEAQRIPPMADMIQTSFGILNIGPSP